MSWYAWLPLVLCTVPLQSRVIFILSWRAECSNPRFPAQGCSDLGKKGRNLEDWCSLVSFVYRESSTLNFYCNSVRWGMALLFVFESNPAGSGKSPSRLTEPQLLRGNFQPGEAPGHLCLPWSSGTATSECYWSVPKRSCGVLLFLLVLAHTFQRVWELGQDTGVCSVKETCGASWLLLI